MKLILQRVTRGSVTVDGNVVGQIGRGAVCLVGIHKDDTEADLDWMAKKMLSFCLWPDDTGKPWRLGIKDTDAGVLLVSQFTLHARYGNGKRPDFSHAMEPERAKVMFDIFVEKVKALHKPELVQTGTFGAMMMVDICNDGPVTFSFNSFEKRD